MAGLIPLILKPASAAVASSPTTQTAPTLTNSSIPPAPAPAPAPPTTPQCSVAPDTYRSPSHRPRSVRPSSIAATGRMSSQPTLTRIPHKSSGSTSNRSLPGSWSPDAISVPDPKHRFSLPLSMPTPLIPFTSAEWAKVLAEVKRHFLNRRFRQCAARSNEVLGATKDRTVEPAYLIFLNFYTAASLESSIRTLHSSSPYRLRMLQQVREHYAVADQLARDEDDSVSRASRRSSSNSSCSIRTMSSRAATTSTGVSSPTQSMYSTAPPKKRVTFCDMAAEPMVRPDSPTLGFEDWVICRDPEPAVLHERHGRHADNEPGSASRSADVELGFMSDGPFDRYASVISDLRSRISTHLANVDVEMRLSPVSGVPGVVDAEEKQRLRALELRARIERLRGNGWQRKRFDPKRYEALYDEVTAELSLENAT